MPDLTSNISNPCKTKNKSCQLQTEYSQMAVILIGITVNGSAQSITPMITAKIDVKTIFFLHSLQFVDASGC